MLDGLRYLGALRQVMRDGRRSPAELEGLVRHRLGEVLVSAYLHVPYYREAMREAGYDPVRDYRGPEDLARLPITTKADLKQRGTTAFVMEGSDLSRCATDSTSGSTGIPTRVYRDPHERALQIAKWLRVLFLNGYSVRQKVLSLTGPGRLDEGRSVLQRFGVFRRLAVDYFQPPAVMVDQFLTYRPDVLYGNRSHLDLMALELRRRGIECPGLSLLVGGAEVIQESHRRLYRQQFGVELVESYGSVEMGVMAHETPDRDGLHLCEDLTYFEFLDRDGQPVPSSEPGRVVVTDLTAKRMPLIRYDQGDLAVHVSVRGADGRAVRRLTRIMGRESDYAVLPDGTRCPLYVFSIVIKKFEDIAQFRVVQKTRSRFQVLVVADPDYLLSIRDDLLRRLQEQFPATVTFEIVQVPELAPDPSGKLKLLVSEVDEDTDRAGGPHRR